MSAMVYGCGTGAFGAMLGRGRAGSWRVAGFQAGRAGSAGASGRAAARLPSSGGLGCG